MEKLRCVYLFYFSTDGVDTDIRRESPHGVFAMSLGGVTHNISKFRSQFGCWRKLVSLESDIYTNSHAVSDPKLVTKCVL